MPDRGAVGQERSTEGGQLEPVAVLAQHAVAGGGPQQTEGRVRVGAEHVAQLGDDGGACLARGARHQDCWLCHYGPLFSSARATVTPVLDDD